MSEEHHSSPHPAAAHDLNAPSNPSFTHTPPAAPSWQVPSAPALNPPPSHPGTSRANGTNGAYHVNAAPSFRSWQPGIIALRPLSFGDFLTVPFKAMRYNRAVVLGAPLLFTLLSTVLVLVTMWLVFTDPQLGLLNSVPTLSGISWTSVAMIIVSLLAVLLADVFSSSVIAPGVARAVLGERITIGLAWKQVQRRLGALLLLYVASAAILTTLVVVTLLPTLISIATGEPNAGVIALSLLLFLGVMIPAGLLVTLFQGIARAVIVLEGVSVSAGLRRVKKLLPGRFWWSVLILFVSMILINVVSSVLQYMGQFGFIGVVLLAPDSMVVLAVSFMVIYGLSYVVSLVLIYSYLGSIFALMYIDMRMRREGFDLDLARAAEERAGR